jgi:hypothetical protein
MQLVKANVLFCFCFVFFFLQVFKNLTLFMTKLRIMVLYLMDNIGSKVMPIVNLGISLHFQLGLACTSGKTFLALPHIGTGLLLEYI